MYIDKNSLLVTMNPLYFLIGCVLICLLAWFCVKRYYDTNDFKKSVNLYTIYIIILDIFLIMVLEIKIFLCIGIDIFGFIVLALISNYYFYH